MGAAGVLVGECVQFLIIALRNDQDAMINLWEGDHGAMAARFLIITLA